MPEPARKRRKDQDGDRERSVARHHTSLQGRNYGIQRRAERTYYNGLRILLSTHASRCLAGFCGLEGKADEHLGFSDHSSNE